MSGKEGIEWGLLRLREGRVRGGKMGREVIQVRGNA